MYGLGPGFYMVLPILGPSAARDAVGLVGDTFLDPITYLLSFGWALGVQFVHTETDLTFRINEYEELTEAAVDPYAAVKDFYLQYRAKQIRESGGYSGGVPPGSSSIGGGPATRRIDGSINLIS